ncbi:P-mevalo-kinase multi-domain protein [Pyrenophora tritici-repentis]|nr:P-mevalo-kinase multi-domain protein [Pyrenophora tritici-repentis]KAI0582414.1 P-mevalo-kinase multi-domain protein [Pyrenophora tritici-repentis]PZD23210.1 Apt, Adenineguanine phosphoribosyltransferase PRPP-binding protein [Pyrenophora tritici-repentis]
MATLETLQRALLKSASEFTPADSPRQALSDEQYATGFSVFSQEPGRSTYSEFIIPELSYLLAPLHDTEPETRISVLEIGPGPKSVFGDLPQSLRRKIETYTAFEPNAVFAIQLEDWLKGSGGIENKAPLPGLKRVAVHPVEFSDVSDTEKDYRLKKYDIVLFCHSMYGMKPKNSFIGSALGMLVEGGIVAVFHRDGALHIEGLVCHYTVSFPTGVVGVPDRYKDLNQFASFVAGFGMQDEMANTAVQAQWRALCRSMGRRDGAYPEYLIFSAPEVMTVFNEHADSLPELMWQVPQGRKIVKNKEACLHSPAYVARPRDVKDVQICVRWALQYNVGLTVIGGGHSTHCLRPNVVAIDMSGFDSVHILRAVGDEGKPDPISNSFVIAGTGCKTDGLISQAMCEGLTVPLGSRPSVGAGLWLQGGIGHLTRLHGLTCDIIVGAVMVSVKSGEVFYIGNVPEQHRPPGAFLPTDEADILWAIRGAGTNMGIVTSVTFKAFPALQYLTRNWVLPLNDEIDARKRLNQFDKIIAGRLGRSERHCSADAYLYHEAGQLRLGMTTFELVEPSFNVSAIRHEPMGEIWGPVTESKVVDGLELFEEEMYMSGMHGGHGGGKTSSFKRCILMKDISEEGIAARLISAVETRPSPLCYLHLLHGGGAVRDLAATAVAFGCRTWSFACVITGVWPRDEDGTALANACVQWVYDLAKDLLPFSSGAYGVDLGPDPRDAELAVRAFGPNGSRLGRLKRDMYPHGMLAYACPLPKAPPPKLVVLVTGESCAGKDHCAHIWASLFLQHRNNTEFSAQGPNSRVMSISDATKREYAAAVGADFDRLLEDRAYKEEHRAPLTEFFQQQVQKRPQLPEEHFSSTVRDATAADVDVLFITGMRDKAPVASFAHLVPESRLVEIRVEAKEHTRIERGADTSKSSMKELEHRPSLIFQNDKSANEPAESFARSNLIPLIHDDLQQLADMVRSIPSFPTPGIEFRHVLDIAQQQGGMRRCVSLLQTLFSGNWDKVKAIVSVGVGSLVFASSLTERVDKPLVLVREEGKLPPPTIYTCKPRSHISFVSSSKQKVTRIEMERDAVPVGASVVVVDDVLATGETLCAVLQLLVKAGVALEDVSVMVVAEFPVHRGRALLYERGYGKVNVQSLLVFNGV